VDFPDTEWQLLYTISHADLRSRSETIKSPILFSVAVCHRPNCHITIAASHCEESPLSGSAFTCYRRQLASIDSQFLPQIVMIMTQNRSQTVYKSEKNISKTLHYAKDKNETNDVADDIKLLFANSSVSQYRGRPAISFHSSTDENVNRGASLQSALSTLQ